MNFKQWNDFKGGKWQKEINVRSFIQANYQPYTGNDSFLTNPTEKTQKLWNEVLELYKQERESELRRGSGALICACLSCGLSPPPEPALPRRAL